jgi:hypothetical protein
MKIEYEGKQYDLRLKSRYLPKPLRNINTLDLAILLANRGVDKSYKLTIIREYLPGAKVL